VISERQKVTTRFLYTHHPSPITHHSPSPMSHQFDIVIIGGGMVGACVAALIASEPALSDVRVALIEAHLPSMPPPNSDVDLRVSAISRASERILQRAQAWPHVPLEYRSDYQAMTVWDAADKHDSRAALHFLAAEIGEPNLGYIIENRRLQWALLSSVSLRERVTVINSQVQSLDVQSEAACITLQDGRMIRAGLIIAADGAQSKSRELVGIATSGWRYDQSAVVTHVQTEKPHRETAWQRFTPNGPLAFLPLKDGRCSIVWTNPTDEAERLIKLSNQEFARELEVASDGVLGAIVSSTPRVCFPLQLQAAKEYVRPRFVLVGDAAHAVHPLAGQGVNLGFMDAACLIETLASARRDGASIESLSELRVLRRYERWRKSENLMAMGLFDGLNKLFSNHSTVMSYARRTGFGLIESSSIAKRSLIQRALGLVGETPEMVRDAGTNLLAVSPNRR
jgi:2-polyprenylphenol 6-hydroxylase